MSLNWDLLFPVKIREPASLVVPFSEEEIKKSVDALPGDKSPGPDGFSLCFFQHFWQILKSDVIEMFDGKVCYVKQDSQEGGDDSAFIDRPQDSIYYYKGNRIEMDHGNNQYTGYEHLAFESSLVKASLAAPSTGGAVTETKSFPSRSPFIAALFARGVIRHSIVKPPFFSLILSI